MGEIYVSCKFNDFKLFKKFTWQINAKVFNREMVNYCLPASKNITAIRTATPFSTWSRIMD